MTDVGEGYRELGPDEPLQPGDQLEFLPDKWTESEDAHKGPERNTTLRYRRRIDPEQPQAPEHSGDNINRPTHYTWHPSGVECNTIAEHFPHHIASAMEYMWRCDHKGTPIADLRKAIRHLEMEVEKRERYQ